MKTLSQFVMVSFIAVLAISSFAMPSYNDVLLVVNTQSPESQEIGAYFKAARHLPDANVCSISVKAGVDGARMSIAEKWVALATIKSYMSKNNLTDKINYIVLTRGIPFYAVSEYTCPIYKSNFHLFDVFLMYNLSKSASDPEHVAGIFYNNPYFYYFNDMLSKKFSQKQFGYYIVARLDGLGTVTIKNFIDSTGAPAYESYKKQANGKMKLLTVTPYYDQTNADEINRRGNIDVVSPNPLPPDEWEPVAQKTTLNDIATDAAGQIQIEKTFDKVAKDVMFSFMNDVGWEQAFPWPKGNHYYVINDFVNDYPFIYRGATFLPGSILTVFCSFPAAYNSHGGNGGPRKVNLATKIINNYVKTDASDMKFRHMTCVGYDPVNNQLWAGTGKNQLDVAISFDKRASDEVHRETMRNYGGGIAIYDSNGNILKYINANDPGSPLKNNRVVKLVYDKNSQYMWIAHYKGIQYYDLSAKKWNDIPELQCDYAAAADICLDPFDSDKVYFSFYYNGANSDYKKTSSQIAGADSSIFEYSKSAKTVTPYVIDAANNKGILPQMAKTSVNTIWVSKGNILYRYDLSAKAVVEQIDMDTVIPEMTTPPDNLKSPVTIDCIRNVIGIPSAKAVLAAVGCNIIYTTDLIAGTPSTCQKKNYIVRITENAIPPSTVETINISAMNSVSSGAIPDFKIRDVAADPSTSGKTMYMALSTYPGTVLRSTDGAGASWSVFSTDYLFYKTNGIVLDGKGNLYTANGYEFGQNIAADFQAFGLGAYGGGVCHDTMTYGNNYDVGIHGVFSGPYYYSVSGEAWSWGASEINPWNQGYRGSSQTEAMMFMMLDGFYTGEARLGIFRNYPMGGGLGHTVHMLVFEPKCAPFAPRVNEAMIPANPQVMNKATIEIPILSPGLPWHMNGVIPETLNKDTIQITDETGAVFTPDKIEFFPPTGPDPDDKDGRKFITGTGKLVIFGNYTGILYKVKLICGVNGIKNAKGASLTNTRPDEFKDDITLAFGNGFDISKGTYVPPEQITGPVKMPQTNSKVDLVVSKVWLDTTPTAWKPLTIKFQIQNIGTARTNAGTITANVYWNNILAGSVVHGDLAAGAVTAALSFTLDAQYVTVGHKNTAMIVADGPNKVDEMRESNNTNSIPFFIDNRPDLIVKGITLSSTRPGETIVNFSIANTGFGPTAVGEQTAAVYLNNKQIGAVNYNDLAKGTVVSLQLASVTITAGTCRMKVVADSTGKVTEVSETNNSFEKAFSIK